MRPLIVQFLEASLVHLPIEGPVYEFGSYLVEGQEELADLRPVVERLKPGLEYVGCDMRDGPGVDRILNLMRLELEDDSVGAVICLDTLEHVENPFTAVNEIRRVLRPGGFALLSSVMNFPIHAHPDDYWRFTPSGFKYLCKDAGFPQYMVMAAGPKLHPHTVVAAASKGGAPGDLAAFSSLGRALGFWQERWR